MIGQLPSEQDTFFAFLCSSKASGSVILKTYDLFERLAASSYPIISGFHSPLEKECLRIMLREKHRVIWCPARSIERLRVPASCKPSVDAGVLSIVSPFPPGNERMTATLAAQRNAFLLSVADHIVAPSVSPGGKLVRDLLFCVREGKKVYTFEEELIEEGARSLDDPGSLELHSSRV